jgi:hypothetical protein
LKSSGALGAVAGVVTRREELGTDSPEALMATARYSTVLPFSGSGTLKVGVEDVLKETQLPALN